MPETLAMITTSDLPGLDCGLCGVRTCAEFADRVRADAKLLERCIHLSPDLVPADKAATIPVLQAAGASSRACDTCMSSHESAAMRPPGESGWRDTLGREFDFYLEHFPEDPGPREVMLPHNPLLTREMNIQVGDVLIGRPLGMSCGCPITHCGVVMQVDARTGVIVWCVTGPLNPRQQGFKDIGYYTAEAYEGLITASRVDVRIGMRYFFQPRLCMLQWRHSGLVNYISRNPGHLQVRLEGLWIG